MGPTMGGNLTIVFPRAKVAALEDRDPPRAEPGSLVVRTRRSLISTGTELTLFSGEYPPGSSWADYGKFPCTPGYSNVGLVEAVGEGVDRSWIGRRVATFTNHRALVTARPTEADPVPEGVADEDATFFSIALIVMQGVRLSETTWGEAVAIYGAGLIGQFAARFLALAGARPVFVVDTAPPRLAMLPKHPAIVPVDESAVDPAAMVRERTGGRMCDAVIEATGNPTLIPREFDLLKKPFGRFLLLSSPRGVTTFDFHDFSNRNSSRIIGAHQMSTAEVETPYSPWTKRRHVALFFDWLRSGEFSLAGLVTHRFPPAKAPEAYQMLLTDRSKAMGVMFEW